jgi:hypothetical protein
MHDQTRPPHAREAVKLPGGGDGAAPGRIKRPNQEGSQLPAASVARWSRRTIADILDAQAEQRGEQAFGTSPSGPGGLAGSGLNNYYDVADEVVCAWHGWHWDLDGSNALIPYGKKETCKPHVRPYPTQEWYGIIVVWFDRDGQEPWWQLPEVPEV